MWRKIGIVAISVLSLVLMTTVAYAQEGTPPGAAGRGMMGQDQGMMGIGPMCGGMMGQGMRGMMGSGMMGDPACGVLHQFGGPGVYSKWAGQLDLSEDQQRQLESIWTSHLKVVIQKRAALQIVQLELKEALGKDAPDYDGAKSRIERINDLREEIALDHLSAIQKARKVLTPEQLKKFKSLRRIPIGGGPGMRPPMREKQPGMRPMPMHPKKGQ